MIGAMFEKKEHVRLNTENRDSMTPKEKFENLK